MFDLNQAVVVSMLVSVLKMLIVLHGAAVGNFTDGNFVFQQDSTPGGHYVCNAVQLL